MKKIFLFLTIALLSIVSNAQEDYTYPVVVSFNSMCCGVPDSGPIMALIKNFKKQNRIKQVAVDSIGPMGKEGEYYLAFRLKEMTKSQKIKFITQLKKIVPTMTDKGSAEIKENEVVDMPGQSSRVTVTTIKL